MVPPGNRLEKLKGRLNDFYSTRINDQLRVIFRWHDGEAYDVRRRVLDEPGNQKITAFLSIESMVSIVKMSGSRLSG